MSDEKALTKYGSVDVGAAAARRLALQEEQKSRKRMAGFLKIDEGQTMVRIGPPWKMGEPLPVKEAWLHKLKDPNDLEGVPKWTIPCPAKNHGKPCLICQRCKQLKATGDKTDKEVAFQWGAQQRYYAQVLQIDKMDEGWLLWEFGPMVYDPLLAILGNPELGGDITHPVTGHNCIVDRVGKGKKDTRYKLQAVIKPSKFPKPELLDKMLNLDDLTAEWAHDRIAEAMEDPAGTNFPPKDSGDRRSTAQDDLAAGGDEADYTPPGEDE